MKVVRWDEQARRFAPEKMQKVGLIYQKVNCRLKNQQELRLLVPMVLKL